MLLESAGRNVQAFASAREAREGCKRRPPACLVTDIYRYASGHDPAPGEKDWMGYLQKQFAADGYRLPDLLRRIAVSDDFYRISPAGNGEPGKEATR